MTCIVGIVDNGTVYIGGDSAGVSNNFLTIRNDAKVFYNHGAVFGFTSSFRMGQLLRYSFMPPKRHYDDDLMEYMCTIFVDTLRTTLKKGGYAKKEHEVESAGTFLVGIHRQLFEIDSDYQVGQISGGYSAVGSGREPAMGSLFTTQNLDVNLLPHDRVFMALRAAQAFNSCVREPFRIVDTIEHSREEVKT